MATGIAAVIMAAGKSTRMKSALPKAAHLICGKPMTRHVIDACRNAGVEQVVVVVGHEAEKVKSALGDDVFYALQAEQKGTGHACMPVSYTHLDVYKRQIYTLVMLYSFLRGRPGLFLSASFVLCLLARRCGSGPRSLFSLG